MARNRICRAMAQPSTAQWTRVANMQVKRRRASGIERDNPSGVERRSTSGVVQKRAEKLNYALAVLLSLLCPGTPLAPCSAAPSLSLIKQLELKNRQSTNILLFAHKHIYRVCQCRE